MKTISNMEEYRSALQEVLSVIIFVTKAELENITATDLQSRLEAVIPAKNKLLCEFYLANIEDLMEVAVSLEIMGTPAIAAFAMGEMLSCRVFGDPEDFDGWNEDELFDFSQLPVCLSEFLEDLG